jgi:hypothetical protein
MGNDNRAVLGQFDSRHIGGAGIEPTSDVDGVIPV